MPIATFSLVAFDCPDPRSLADFYREIVGGTIDESDGDGDWVQLNIEGASDLAFQLDRDFQPPEWPDGLPQQAHIDLDVADLDEGERHVLAAGGRKADVQPRPDSWRVFLDPAGHPFCLVKA